MTSTPTASSVLIPITTTPTNNNGTSNNSTLDPDVFYIETPM